MSNRKILEASGYIIGFVLLIVLFLAADFDDVLIHLHRIKPSMIGVLIVLQIITQLLIVFQWNTITNVVIKKVSFFQLLSIYGQGSVVEAITPGAKVGGEATRLYLLKKELKCSTEDGLSVIVIQKSISMSVLFSICVISLVFIGSHIVDYLIFELQLVAIVVGVGMVALMIALLAFPARLGNLLKEHPNKVVQKITKYLNSYAKSIKRLSKAQWAIQFIASMIVWVLFPLKMVILAHALGIDVPLVFVLAITMVSYMIGMLPLSPGGIGVFEGTMTGLLILFSVDSSVALTAAVVFRLITFWLVILMSLGVVCIHVCCTRFVSRSVKYDRRDKGKI